MIGHVSVTEQIIGYMKTQIDEGIWKTGEKIPSENMLMRELGVSRASVRDAVKYFSGQGLLESVHGKGTFLLEQNNNNNPNVEMMITAEDFNNVSDVLEFRRIVESEGCRKAATQMSSEALEELKSCLEKMKDTVNDRDTFVKTDIEFHLIIARESGNPLIHKTLMQVYDEADTWMKRNYYLFGYQNGIYHHKRIMNALEKHDPDAAYQMMHDHMQSSIDKLKKKEIIQ